MYKRFFLLAILFLLFSVFIQSCHQATKSTAPADISSKQNEIALKPYRVLVKIGDSGTDFLDVVNMLKIWGVPSDILRLYELLMKEENK